MKKNLFALLKKRRFAPFFITQFFGVFNDNLYKNALLILLAVTGYKLTSINPNYLTNLTAVLFILPFFLFSATFGQLADKYEKTRLIHYVKILEIAIAICASIAFHFSNIYLLFTALFLLGAHSALFGPIKYAILPQHLKKNELIAGNAWVEAGTFMAILLGTLAGGLLIAQTNGPLLVSLLMSFLAIAGFIASLAIPRAASFSPDLKINWNPFSETYKNLMEIKKERALFLAMLGISWFWFYGATFLTQLPVFTSHVLGGNVEVITLLLALFSIGIGVGALLCEILGDGKLEIGLVPLGSLGLSLFAADIYWVTHDMHATTTVGLWAFLSEVHHIRVLVDILLLGVFGGLYTVPLYAFLQLRSKSGVRSRVIASNNILNALLMVMSAMLAIILFALGLTIPEIFLTTAILNALVAGFIYRLLPEFLLRFIFWLLIHSFYRLRTSGLENIPEKGPVILICNHISYVDALVIAAACNRPPRFVIDYGIYNWPVLHAIFKAGHAIPITTAKQNKALLTKAYEEIAQALSQGEVVCIFPEGWLTYNGRMNSFKPGIIKMAQESHVPIIPMALRGLWGSIFSRNKRRWRIFRPFRRIGLYIGPEVLPEHVTTDNLHAIVSELRKGRGHNLSLYASLLRETK